MSFSIVQHVANDGFTSTPNVTVTATTAGNLLVAFIGTSNNSGNNTFSSLPTGWTQIGSTQNQNVWIGLTGGAFYLKNCAGGTTSFSWTLNAAPSEWDIQFIEISGADTSSPLDTSNVANVASLHTSDSVSTTTTANGDLVIGMGIWDDTPTNPSAFNDGGSWTLIQTHSDGNGWETIRAVQQTQSSSGSISYAPSWTGSVDDILFIASFKASGGAAAPPPSSTLALMGVG